MHKRKVKWTFEEEDFVVNQMITMMQNNVGVSSIKLMNRLQTNLPPDRRRTFRSTTDPIFHKVVYVVERRLEEQRMAYRHRQSALTPKVIVRSHEEVLADMTLAQVSAYYFMRLSEHEAQERDRTILKPMVVSPSIELAAPPVKFMPHFVVIGLHKQQPEMIKPDYSNKLMLTFLDAKERVNISTGDCYFLMSKWSRAPEKYNLPPEKLQIVRGRFNRP